MQDIGKNTAGPSCTGIAYMYVVLRYRGLTGCCDISLCVVPAHRTLQATRRTPAGRRGQHAPTCRPWRKPAPRKPAAKASAPATASQTACCLPCLRSTRARACTSGNLVSTVHFALYAAFNVGAGRSCCEISCHQSTGLRAASCLSTFQAPARMWPGSQPSGVLAALRQGTPPNGRQRRWTCLCLQRSVRPLQHAVASLPRVGYNVKGAWELPTGRRIHTILLSSGTALGTVSCVGLANMIWTCGGVQNLVQSMLVHGGPWPKRSACVCSRPRDLPYSRSTVNVLSAT